MKGSQVEKGDRFRVVKDTDSIALTTWGAWTGGYDCTIPKDTIIIADHDQVAGAEGFSAVPENYKEIEEMVIPEENRKHQYEGYNLVFMQSDIGNKLIIIND